jgi:pyrroloquinoline quinone biosynthesis protein D
MDIDATPRLAAGCRLHATESVLLVPEGTLNLSGPAREILTKLDGKQSVSDIVAELLQQYSDANADEVRSDVLSLLNRMQERGVVKV